jgi:PAS domain S-box-containing protein
MSSPPSSDSGPDNSLEALCERVSQSASGEAASENLIDALMRASIEYAGAERSVLILARREEFWIEAEATAGRGAVSVDLRKAKTTATAVPESLLQYAVRTKDALIVHHALDTGPFAADEYFRAHHPGSILCMPLFKQNGLIGIIYLEGKLADKALAPAQVAVIKLLATEAAMSLENTHLYTDIQERDTKTRRIIDSSLDAVLSMGESGIVTEWNVQAETMFGWRRDEAVGRSLTELLIPPQYRDAHDKGLRHFLSTGEGPLLNRRIEITALQRNGTEFR